MPVKITSSQASSHNHSSLEHTGPRSSPVPNISATSNQSITPKSHHIISLCPTSAGFSCSTLIRKNATDDPDTLLSHLGIENFLSMLQFNER